MTVQADIDDDRLKLPPTSDLAGQTCAWFVRCDRPATHWEPHPAFGFLPACDRCMEVVGK